jgi:primase-polymerase (primpol)-like protein
MATAMNPEPEYTRQERFIQYAETLKERFAEGCLFELQDLDQWVVWRAELEDSKPKKVPYNPHNYDIHARASVNIPTSWGTLDQALTALASGHYSGIGFVLTPPLVMIDLDHSVDRATGTITDPNAQEIVQSLNSYTECSPSRTGLHILSYGQLPGKGIHTQVEIYGQQRFTTITTEHLVGTPPTIEHRQEALAALYHQFAPVTETSHQNTGLGVGADAGNELTDLPEEAEHDAVLQRLLSGDISSYSSQSNADFVLIMKLLHWTGDNIELTRSIFLSSPLGQREKAQRRTGQTTYVDMTINNVLNKRRNPPMKR